MKSSLAALALSSLLAVSALPVGCAQNGADIGTGAGSNEGGSGAAGGAGGGAADGGGGSASTSNGGGGFGTGGGGVGSHLVISEIGVAPEANEFIEIYNPTDAEIDLSDYYLSDNSAYYGLAAGDGWAPITENEGTDFLARFPSGAKIPGGGVLVVAAHASFKDTYGCPDFVLAVDAIDGCSSGKGEPMLEVAKGSLGSDEGMLSNDREMLILFRWGGTEGNAVEDVDYVTWGEDFEDGTRVDKSGEPGYADDTAPGAQDNAPAPFDEEGVMHSIERCVFDSGEAPNGNGIDGRDATSEQLATSFVEQNTPTPGEKNACLP